MLNKYTFGLYVLAVMTCASISAMSKEEIVEKRFYEQVENVQTLRNAPAGDRHALLQKMDYKKQSSDEVATFLTKYPNLFSYDQNDGEIEAYYYEINECENPYDDYWYLYIFISKKTGKITPISSSFSVSPGSVSSTTVCVSWDKTVKAIKNQ